MRDPCRLLLLLLVTAGAEVHTVQFAPKFSGQALARKQQHEIALSSLNRGKLIFAETRLGSHFW